MPQEVQLTPPGTAQGEQSAWSQTGTAAAAAITLTQAAAAGKVNFCTGIQITGAGATAASTIVATLQSGGTTIANFVIPIPAGVNALVTPLQLSFDTPIAGLGVNQNMVLTVPSFGAGNLNAAANMQGFSQ